MMTQLRLTTTSTTNKTLKRPLSDSSSLKPPTNLHIAASNSLKENILKKTKIRSCSNSSCKSDTKSHKDPNLIELFFKNKDTLYIRYLKFKYILDNFTNRSINTHSLSENANIDSLTLKDLLDEIRPIANDKTLKHV